MRLPGAAYHAPGVYFLTICTHGRQRLFGEVRAGTMHLSAFGQIAAEEWRRTAEVRPYVVLDVFVVMPDHVHVLFGIRPHEGNAGASHGGTPQSHGGTPQPHGGTPQPRRGTPHPRRGTPAVCPDVDPVRSPVCPDVGDTASDSNAETSRPDGRRFGAAVPHSVPTIMRQYKSIVTKRIRTIDPTVRVWQRSFHDRIVRTPREAAAVRRYIVENPARWTGGTERRDGHRR